MCNSSSVKLQPKPVKADSSSECGHHNVSLYKIEDEENKRDHDYEKWMSSTARLTRKMMRLPSTSSDLATKKALNNITRVCADCNTTSTPLWRSGPNGPKVISLSFFYLINASYILLLVIFFYIGYLHVVLQIN